MDGVLPPAKTTNGSDINTPVASCWDKFISGHVPTLLRANLDVYVGSRVMTVVVGQVYVLSYTRLAGFEAVMVSSLHGVTHMLTGTERAVYP